MAKRGRKKNKDIGRAILKKDKEKSQLIPIEGILPCTGLYVINPQKKIIAGRIVKVRKNGEIVIRGGQYVNHLFITDQLKIMTSGYQYAKKVPETFLGEVN